MSFLNNLIHTAARKRLETSGNKEVYGTAVNYPCLLQPLSDQAAAQSGLDFSVAHRCFMQASADVKPNDELTINGLKYRVHSIKHHNYGSDPHKRVLVEQIV